MRTIQFFAIITLFTFTNQAIAQKNKIADKTKIIQEKAGRPDVPGDLFIDLGVNLLQGQPKSMELNVFKSRYFNFSYQYPFQILKSSISFHPGLGIATEKYTFKNDLTLTRLYDSNIGSYLAMDTVRLHVPSDNPDYVKTRKSQLGTVYLEVPLELRWTLFKNNPKQSLKVAAGAKFGYLIDAKTKVVYYDDGRKRINKQKEKFELEKFKYGVYGKIGYGNIYGHFYYGLSDLFKKDRGPEGTDTFPIQAGISISLF